MRASSTFVIGTDQDHAYIRKDVPSLLKRYLKKIGGRRAITTTPHERSPTSKGRSRPRCPRVSAQAPKQPHQLGHTGTPLAPQQKCQVWKPPPGSWEDEIESIDACEPLGSCDGRGNKELTVFVTWNNGQKTRHSMSTLYWKCPRKVRQLYIIAVTGTDMGRSCCISTHTSEFPQIIACRSLNRCSGGRISSAADAYR